MNLNEKLKKSRVDKGLTQGDVAKHLNISRQSISKWENGYNYPDIDNLLALSKLYDIPIDQLLSEKEQETKQTEEVKKAISHEKLEDSMTNKLSHKTQENSAGKNDEGLLLLIISLVSSLVTPIGVIIATIVLRRNKKANTYYRVISILCVCSILINIYISYFFIRDYFHWGVENNVQLIE